MAWLFELEADCVSEEAAKRFGEHFATFNFSLPDGRVCGFTASDSSIYLDSDGHARCCLVSVGASFACANAGRNVLHTDDERREFTLNLYEHLRKAPPFRFAVAGIECHEFSLHGHDGQLISMEGLVICEQVFADAGRRSTFESFALGYRWVPFTKDTVIS